jgi:hypothetical protein
LRLEQWNIARHKSAPTLIPLFKMSCKLRGTITRELPLHCTNLVRLWIPITVEQQRSRASTCPQDHQQRELCWNGYNLWFLKLCAFANLILKVNTFPIESKVESLAELSDGSIFSKILGGYRMRNLSVYPLH